MSTAETTIEMLKAQMEAISDGVIPCICPNAHAICALYSAIEPSIAWAVYNDPRCDWPPANSRDPEYLLHRRVN
jgi:hypothetical protein